jgi:hypothetical protein
VRRRSQRKVFLERALAAELEPYAQPGLGDAQPVHGFGGRGERAGSAMGISGLP